jgi:hypothetical protein
MSKIKRTSIADVPAIFWRPSKEDRRLLVEIEKSIMKERGETDPMQISAADIVKEAVRFYNRKKSNK